MSRLAWFSPLPPSRSGIAAYSAEILPLLAARGFTIDAFTETDAHEFVWRHRRQPYALAVYQLGNAACHDYAWGYLFHYPGLVVLHDAQLHQARALQLTRRWRPRRDDYLAEFHANHPDAPRQVGELIAAGRGQSLYQHWPLTRLVIESARLVVVHNARVARTLQEEHPTARITAIEMGVADPLRPGDRRADVLARHHIPPDAVVVAAFGGVTREKRIPELLRALGTIADRHPRLHLMVVGSTGDDYDIAADAQTWRVADRTHLTGYVPDDDLPDYLAAADVCVCLRWPTNRETSGSWLRCLGAGRATIVTDLSHLGDVPLVDPRGWRPLLPTSDAAEPVAAAIDLLDEDHSLELALERLATDRALRARLGRAARAWWEAHHRLEPMADGYQRAITEAQTIAPPPRARLPHHLIDDGSAQLAWLADALNVRERVGEVLLPRQS